MNTKMKLALAALGLAIASPAFANSGSGVTSVRQQGDMIVVQVSTTVPATLEVISGDDVFQAQIPIGDRQVSIPRAAIDDLLTDSDSDVFMLRAADGQPIGSGVRVFPKQRGASEHSPYLVTFVPDDHPGAEAQRAVHGFVPN